MTRLSAVLASFISVILFTATAEAQVLKKVSERVKETAENKVVNRAGEITSDSMDKAEDKLRKGKNKNNDHAGEENLKDDKNGAQSNSEKAITPAEQNSEQPTSSSSTSSIFAYRNFDFVPGDKIIFFYDMSGEQDAEIPARMLINDGNAEIQTFKGEKVLYIPANVSVSMIPDIDKDSYLPEQFTLEFDVLSNEEYNGLPVIELYFRAPEHKNLSWSHTGKFYVQLAGFGTEQGTSAFQVMNESSIYGGAPVQFPQAAVNTAKDNWRRFSLYVNKNIGKVYIDQHRLNIVNRIEPGAGVLTMEIRTAEHPMLIKNIRIAAGGSDAYKRLITEGKIISYGIQFDVNKADLKPESMGAINEMFNLLNEHSDLKVEIGGHTDATGSAEVNEKLSAARAEAVKTQLVKMGIAESRLATKGYGSSQPIADNATPEGKAKNRRVEFKKIN